MENYTKKCAKEYAALLMEQLGIGEFAGRFLENDEIVLFDCGSALFVQDKTLLQKVQNLESSGGVVYAVIHSYEYFGECYSMLYVSKYQEDWNDMCRRVNFSQYRVYAYVSNEDCEWCSEFGFIGVESTACGLVRIS